MMCAFSDTDPSILLVRIALIGETFEGFRAGV